MTPRFRPMTLNDMAEIAAMERDLHPAPWSREQLTETLRLPRYACHVALVDEALAGYLIATHGVDASDLLTIGVARSFQRRGLGTGLIRRLARLTKLRGGQAVFLEVRRDNSAALACYRRLGFETQGVRKAYYATSEGPRDAIVMRGDVDVIVEEA